MRTHYITDQSANTINRYMYTAMFKLSNYNLGDNLEQFGKKNKSLDRREYLDLRTKHG